MDENGDEKLDTDTTSREALVEAVILLNKWWTHASKMVDQYDKVLGDRGLSLDEAADFPLTISTRNKARDMVMAWLAEALTEQMNRLAEEAVEETYEAQND
jgi:hypothetical protein